MLPQLEAFLRNPAPGYALLLSGSWGVGKSYVWSLQAREIEAAGYTPITFSVAGLETREELERALFQSSIQRIGNEQMREAGTLIGRALLRFVKIDPDEVTLKAEVTAGKSIICLDDVERFAGPIKVLFGFVLGLVDDAGAHTVLISDEVVANRELPGFGQYKERVVGKTVRISADIHQFCTAVIEGFATEFSRETLLRKQVFLEELFKQKKVENLRTIRFVLTEIEGILRNLPRDINLGADFEPLLSAVAFWAISTNRDSSNDSLVTDAFLVSDLGMALAFANIRAQRQEPNEEETGAVKLVRDLGFKEEANAWPQSKHLAAIVGGGVPDYLALADEFGLREVVDQEPDALDVLRRFRNSRDEQITPAFEVVRREIHAERVSSLDRFFAIYRTTYLLSRLGILAIDPSVWTDEVVAVLDAIAPEAIDSAEIDVWLGPFDENEQRVVDKIRTLQRRHSNMIAERDRAALRFELLDPAAEVPDASDPIFSGASVTEYLERLRHSDSDGLRRFRGYIDRRLKISNIATFVREDRDFALGLSQEIERQIPFSPPMRIHDAMLREIGGLLSRFVAFLDSNPG